MWTLRPELLVGGLPVSYFSISNKYWGGSKSAYFHPPALRLKLCVPVVPPEQYMFRDFSTCDSTSCQKRAF